MNVTSRHRHRAVAGNTCKVQASHPDSPRRVQTVWRSEYNTNRRTGWGYSFSHPPRALKRATVLLFKTGKFKVPAASRSGPDPPFGWLSCVLPAHFSIARTRGAHWQNASRCGSFSMRYDEGSDLPFDQVIASQRNRKHCGLSQFLSKLSKHCHYLGSSCKYLAFPCQK